MQFNYIVEHVRDGVVIDSSHETNLVPTQGLTHILDAVCKGGAQVPTWYIAPYEGNFTPSAPDTAASLPGAAVECTTYVEAARQTWVEGAIAGGSVDNTASKAEFTMNATKTIYGCWLASVSGKSSTSGLVLSVVRFSASKTFQSGDIMRITAPVSLTAS